MIAVLLNPALRSQRDRVGVAQAQAIQAGLLPNPQITPNAGVVAGGPGTTNPYGIGVSWDVTALITRGAKAAAARESLAGARLDVAWAEWQAAEAAKAAVYDAVALGRQLEEAEDLDARLQKNLAVVQGGFERHQQTILQLSAAQASSATAHERVLSLRQQLEAQRLKLKKAIGLPAEATVALRPGIGLPTRLSLPAEEDLLAHAQQARLDLVALKRGYAAQEQKVREAILAQFPAVNLGFDQATDNAGVNTVGVSATITLPVFDRNQGQIALQRATRQRLFDEYVDRVFTTRADIAKLVANVGFLEQRIAADRDALPALEELVTTYRRATTLGNADILSYYTAWNDLSTKRLELFQLQQTLADDWIALELASGQPLPQTFATAQPGGPQDAPWTPTS